MNQTRMKTFKNLEAFERRIEKGPNWDDLFRLDGKTYNIYEAGPPAHAELGYKYVYFVNRNTHDTIHVRYSFTAEKYIHGVCVRTNAYQLVDIDIIPNMQLWR